MQRTVLPHHYRGACQKLVVSSLLLMLSATPGVLAAENHSHHQHHVTTAQALRISQDFYTLPDIELVTNKGESTNINTLMGNEPVIVNFIFTTCTAICPIQTATFSQLDRMLKKENIKARLISVSIDPEKDTPEQLARYATKFDAASNWIFLTGQKQNIIDIQKAFHAFRGNKMNHEPVTFIRKNNDAAWTRIEGFSSAADILSEYKKM